MKLSLIFPLAILFSIIYFLLMIFIIIRMPPDYFTKETALTPSSKDHNLLWLIAKVVKNVIGFVLIITGIVMLFLPGQGLLTILMGIFFVDFPGKRKIELYLIRKPQIYQAINWIRAKANKPPLML